MDNPGANQTVRVNPMALREFITRVLTTLEVSPSQAAIVADVMVAANLRGVDSHGVALLNWYVNTLTHGLVLKSGSAVIEAEGAGFATVNARNTLGAPAAIMAMDKCLELARTNGLACVTVRNGNHFGMAGYYAMKALPEDMIGVAMTNASRLVAPTFGVEPMLGTNPIAVAVPAGSEYPFVLDMATSTRPFGKAIVAKERGELLPEGVAIDAKGQPVHDPGEFIEAVRKHTMALLPLGSFAELASYKGYGLAMLVDILSGVLSGSNFGKHVNENPEEPANVGHWFMAINVKSFLPVNELKTRMDTLIKEIKKSRKAPGQQRIYIPGEIEFETEIERTKNGIPLHLNLVNVIQSMTDDIGTPVKLVTLE